MNKGLFNSLLVLSTGILLASFMTPTIDCAQLKKGIFHSYSKRTGAHIIITRMNGVQQDINTSTHDTTYWKLDWLSDCRFVATYLTGSGPKTADEKTFYQSSFLYFEVKEIADNYYVGTTTVKAPNGNSSSTDTTWFTERFKY